MCVYVCVCVCVHGFAYVVFVYVNCVAPDVRVYAFMCVCACVCVCVRVCVQHVLRTHIHIARSEHTYCTYTTHEFTFHTDVLPVIIFTLGKSDNRYSSGVISIVIFLTALIAAPAAA